MELSDLFRRRFNESVQQTIEKNPGMDTEAAEEFTYDTLEIRYRAEVIDQYNALLKIYQLPLISTALLRVA